MFCSKCGSTVESNTKFCAKCGTRISETNTSSSQSHQDTSMTMNQHVGVAAPVSIVTRRSSRSITTLLAGVFSVIALVLIIYSIVSEHGSMQLEVIPVIIAFLLIAVFAFFRIKKVMMLIPMILILLASVYNVIRDWGWGIYNTISEIIIIVAIMVIICEIVQKKRIKTVKIVAIVLLGIGLFLKLYNIYFIADMYSVPLSLIIHYNKYNLISEILLIIILLLVACGLHSDKTQEQESQSSGGFLETKSIGVSILLCFVTLGIYTIAWIYDICQDIKKMDNNQSGSVGELLCVMFLPFYIFYWIFTRSQTLSLAAGKRGIQVSDNSTINLVLQIFGLGLISLALIQSSLNLVAIELRSDIAGSQSASQIENPSTTPDVTDTLSKLYNLYKQGVLTETEFEEKKRELLSRV